MTKYTHSSDVSAPQIVEEKPQDLNAARRAQEPGKKLSNAGRPTKFDKIALLQLKLDRGLKRRLKTKATSEAIASGRPVSMSEVVRRCIEAQMDSQGPLPAALEPSLAEASFQLRTAGKLLNMFLRDYYKDQINEDDFGSILTPTELGELIDLMKSLATEYQDLLREIRSQ